MAYTTIDDPSVYFQTTIYTGNGGNDHNITNTGNSNLSPDWIWLKNRGRADSHVVYDTSRSPTGTMKLLHPDLDLVEADDGAGTFVSFDSDGFTVGANGFRNNFSDDTYVAWQWKANGGTRTTNTESGNNPAGGFQANTTAGFSIVDYTGTGSAGTMAHGLGAVPHMILFKNRGEADDWAVYHQGNTSAPETDFLRLNTNGATTDNSNFMNDTAPTSSVFTVGTGDKVNADGETYIAYCFTEKQGYSKFGSYTGNGNADGPFIYTGFKPAWILFKATAGTENWGIFDNRRNTQTGNPRDIYLMPSANNADSSESDSVDFLSNGFKWRISSGFRNADAVNFIYMAFAESPFVSSEGVPTTAR